MNSEFFIRFQISENVSVMLNFSVFHHFGKLTVNDGGYNPHFPKMGKKWEKLRTFRNRIVQAHPSSLEIIAQR